MSEASAENSNSVFEKALSELVRQAVRAEIQEIVRRMREEDRLLTIDQVAQRLSVSRDWVYRNGGKWEFTRKLGPKMVRFSESGLQKWLKAKER